MFNHAIRITLSYELCKDVISKWADRSDKVIVYQHDADEEVSKTHVHLGLYGCEVKTEALKRMWPDAPGKGNEFWSWKEATEEPTKYLTYMSKGTLRPVFMKNFSPDLVETSRQAWVEPSLGNDKSRDSSESVIQDIMKYFKDDEFEEDALDLMFDQVRARTFKVLWAQHRKAPHASYYKIIASTVYLRLCEDRKLFNAGSSRVREKWY